MVAYSEAAVPSCGNVLTLCSVQPLKGSLPISLSARERKLASCVLSVALSAQPSGSSQRTAVPADTRTLADISSWEQIEVKLIRQLLSADNKAYPFIVWSILMEEKL